MSNKTCHILPKYSAFCQKWPNRKIFLIKLLYYRFEDVEKTISVAYTEDFSNFDHRNSVYLPNLQDDGACCRMRGIDCGLQDADFKVWALSAECSTYSLRETQGALRETWGALHEMRYVLKI